MVVVFYREDTAPTEIYTYWPTLALHDALPFALARLAMDLEKSDRDSVMFTGRDLNALPPAELRAARRDFQMVFQDPYGSLDPRQKVERIIAEPLDVLERLSEAARRERIAEALTTVGLRDGDMTRYPHEFSGGQRQHIAIRSEGHTSELHSLMRTAY